METESERKKGRERMRYADKYIKRQREKKRNREINIERERERE